MPLSADLQVAIERYLSGRASASDRQLVDDWYYSFPDEQVEIPLDEEEFRGRVKDRIEGRLRHTLGIPLGEGGLPVERSARIIPIRVIRWTVAAAILVLFLAGGYLYYHTTVQVNRSVTPIATAKNDLSPGTTRATLTLADGRQIALDSSRIGQLAVQGKTRILNSRGAVAYTGTTSDATLYNTLSTGRGQQSPPLTLSDGTKVWLNAASSIRFPVAFTGKSRSVTVTGEAYFEVSPDASRPFLVQAGPALVQVLGTRFDLMAYANEPSIQTTLIDGAVQVGNKDNARRLSPGQQSQLYPDGSMRIIPNTDLDLVTAWKNGMQSFSNADTRTIMRQVERWYGVDISYEGNIAARNFSGDIPRSANLSEVLKLFEVNNIHFTLDAQHRKLTVKP